MNDERISPEEFARLMALPERHAERVAAERSAQFAAMKTLFEEFEGANTAGSADPDVETARAEIARRLASRAATPAARGSVAQRSFMERLLDTWRAPAGRLAFAAVAVAVIAFGWWSWNRSPRTEMMRGEPGGSGFEIALPPGGPGVLVLEWRAVTGADAYRLVLLGTDLGEVARLDLGGATRTELRAKSLPAGLASGASVSIEIQALRAGDVIATTPAKAVRLP